MAKNDYIEIAMISNNSNRGYSLATMFDVNSDDKVSITIDRSPILKVYPNLNVNSDDEVIITINGMPVLKVYSDGVSEAL